MLTDIQGLEDHFGDLDFKVAGTRDGVTALQMDNKAGGITRAILEQALSQARAARMQILDSMEAAIPVPAELSANAPRIFMTTIDPEKIRDVIGPGARLSAALRRRRASNQRRRQRRNLHRRLLQEKVDRRSPSSAASRRILRQERSTTAP